MRIAGWVGIPTGPPPTMRTSTCSTPSSELLILFCSWSLSFGIPRGSATLCRAIFTSFKLSIAPWVRHSWTQDGLSVPAITARQSQLRYIDQWENEGSRWPHDGCWDAQEEATEDGGSRAVV
ncbi:uncharacterized protein K460DRAFT_93540 [Cucurbitaria berberidis CBS 394.84]|uniref:Uncharacterized protein n=1 Tax=Cucurbitaria berberidis CBS 394.84 TaxID=1168544 RepID=A0A9P4GG00_9PLEO|nr:uncharacterized protein K460DRAFT_93540 [Cucurbitaria berberidis CBS 394.84]KAF1844539.1 hypothetical protein K460DRAFT_93540 [Cucurbitaria berberidis CBS 394.84]